MHQTSSRLLRMTEDERPFTKDFKDLFSTLMVSLPLNNHRVRFKSYPFSFTSEEAIGNLGSLKFSQSNRMPDPKDPSRIVTTTTTTTFSMAKEMARSVCQRFMDARFIEPADGKPIPAFPLKGCTWVLTPKGIHVLDRFCQRNGINQEHVIKLLHSPYNTMRLVILERDARTDKLSHDRNTIEVIFRRFAGSSPNIKTNSVMSSDSDSVNDYSDGVTGVKLVASRKIYDKTIKNSFTGKDAVDWLLDCCTTVDRKETIEICTLFVQYNLIRSVFEDKVYIQQYPKGKEFQPTKNAIYVFTDRGDRVAGWVESEKQAPSDKTNGDLKGTLSPRNRMSYQKTDRETNTTRLTSILNDPALRLLFREYLRETVCEENLSFYLDVVEFDKNFKAIDVNKPEAVRETLAAAYGLYNAFLAPGSPCELNIDHTLRQDMASRMTRAVAKDENSMYASLKDVAALFERAQQQVFKLMAGDSVPKFTRSHRYIEVAGDLFEEERDRTSSPNQYSNGSSKS
ncbi:regulator of G protein signaling domain-containing protein [Kalaharituber pfeilii]|nr:regulator of G protein signaling domain-containing protein [Kalaharituber pfeilii]